MRLTARDIAAIIGGQVSGNPDEIVTGLAGVREARRGDLTFVSSGRYLSAIKSTSASVVIVSNDADVAEDVSCTIIRIQDPSQAFAKIVEKAAPPPVTFKAGVHPSASVSSSAQIGPGVSVQAFAVIEDDVCVGKNTVIGAGSYIGHECVIGEDCHIYPRVTLRERVLLGSRVILHSGVVLGADGFGFELQAGKHHKVPQTGTVILGNDVEVGANSTIDRGRFGPTRVGDGTKIDNLVQIGHNCIIGKHCIICGCVGMAGSAVLGDYVTIAGQSGIGGHLSIGDKTVVLGRSGVMKDIPAKMVVQGFPAIDHIKQKKVQAASNRLPLLIEKVRILERQIAELQGEQQKRQS